jgi:DNA-binding beta-propeller fold protein YncE
MWRCSWLLIAGLAASLPAYAYTACVSSEKSNTVSLVDTCNLQVVKTIRIIVATLPSGAGPEQLVDHPYGRRLPVAHEDCNMVAVIDIGKCAGLRQMPVGERPGGVFIAAP